MHQNAFLACFFKNLHAAQKFWSERGLNSNLGELRKCLFSVLSPCSLPILSKAPGYHKLILISTLEGMGGFFFGWVVWGSGVGAGSRGRGTLGSGVMGVWGLDSLLIRDSTPHHSKGHPFGLFYDVNF